MTGRTLHRSAAVLLVIFNRPSLTFSTFERIRSARPTRLFIAGDGPRRDRTEDAEAVQHARTISGMVDWDCDVKTLFRDDNLGCARAVSSAIDWAFEYVDELIVIEDDCQASPSFFPYCGELLQRFRDDQRVFVISGDNYQKGPPRTPYSYYYSRYNHCWGWATWKRAWRHFDFEMRVWPEIRDGGWLEDILRDGLAVTYWKGIFDAVHAGKVDSWAYRWALACWTQGGLSVLPKVNLVENVGFGSDATHTRDETYRAPAARDVAFPLSHPPFVLCDTRADASTLRHHFGVSRWGRTRLRSWKDAILRKVR